MQTWAWEMEWGFKLGGDGLFWEREGKDMGDGRWVGGREGGRTMYPKPRILFR